MHLGYPISPGVVVAATSSTGISGQEDLTSTAQPNRGPTVIILVSLLTSLSVITTTVRLVVRYLEHQLGKDDLAISTAVILSILQLAFYILEALDGLGQHIDYVPTEQVRRILEWAWASEVVLTVVLPLTKISICLFALRIMDRGGWVKVFLYGLMTGLVATNGSCFVILFTKCRPLRAYWDREAGTCWNANTYDDAIWVQVGKDVYKELRDLSDNFHSIRI